MAIELNHTIVPARDPKASAQFLAGIWACRSTRRPRTSRQSHWTTESPWTTTITTTFDSHHYAFQVSDEEFEAAFGRIKDASITFYADPACRQAGQVYTSKNGRRGTYFRDPDGHLMEILTPVQGES